MGADQNLDWARAAASALEWWHDAGADVFVADDPFDWLGAEQGEQAALPSSETAAGAQVPASLPAGGLPDAWEAFQAWRVSQHAPESGWGVPVVGSSGPIDSDLMILVDCPEREERESLLGGAAGRLFDRMLAAIGRSRADVHLASICTARPVAGRLPRELELQLGEIARHHVGLAAPRRLLVMGDAASRAILTANVMEARGRLQSLNHNGGKVTEVVASFHPRMLLERPALKAEAWRDLQMLTGDLK